MEPGDRVTCVGMAAIRKTSCNANVINLVIPKTNKFENFQKSKRNEYKKDIDTARILITKFFLE